MKKAILASVAALMFFTASPAITFAHGGGGNGGPGNMNHMRFDNHRDDHRFDDHNRFRKDLLRDFRNINFRNNIRVFNKVINSDNVRIRNIIRVVNGF